MKKYVKLEGADLEFLQSLADVMPATIDAMHVMISDRFGSQKDPRSISCAVNLLSHYCRLLSLALPEHKTADLVAVATAGFEAAEDDHPSKRSDIARYHVPINNKPTGGVN